MESEGPHKEPGPPAGSESNVVRLPRDWLGSRDELVPFGPSADPPRQPEPAGSPPEATPPSASDFWGEESASVQDALQAPPEPGAAQTPRASIDVALESGHGATDDRARAPRWPRRVSYARRKAASAGGEADTSTSRRRGWASVAAAAVLVVGAAIIAASSGGGASPRVPGPTAPVVARELGHVAAGVDQIANSRLRITQRAKPKAAVAHHGAARVRSGTHRSHPQAAPPASTASTVSISTVAAGGTSVAQPTVSSGGASAGSSGSDSPSGGNSHPAGPVGPRAPFEPGKLG